MSDWKARLQDASLSHLPTDFTRPSPPKNVEAIISRQHAEIDTDILLTALVILVSKCTGDLDISVGTHSSEGLPYVLRVPNIDLESSLSDTLKTVKAIKADFASHAPSFLEQCKAFDTSPLFHIRYLTSDEATKTALVGSTTLDIDLTVYHFRDSLSISYNSLLFRSERIEFFIDQLLQICTLQQEAKLGSLSTVTASQSVAIPNPTVDLNWTNFQGSIPAIFTRNAEAQPFKPCVIVSTPSSTELVYTYDAIHKRSNALSNHLITSGIKRGDVVVIYAFRGVDLVIAVMAILKAGATFSVIDPAYPEERQCIYLNVARPKGLLVLQKAGVLSQYVEEWISSNLAPLKISIPNLEISEDGMTLAGVPSGTSEQNTGVEIGPDDIPTLSFTSGSEGIPKGVRGRHFSLSYYFPWMAKHFGLSADERFTMLSGIAHDPIQRDMFTPLFLGASLIVPTADDIGTPGRLAQWCAEKKVTVTHLTPAMGQLLSSQVPAGVQIPTLKNAFFVGDVLTKRDVKRLQGLAKSVDIINMYGTTETQRSVSFYRIPSVEKDASFLSSCKDIMPAGTGMQDVQLLVVSRDGSRRICGVGEVGEIFVRAGGLAEGYLSLDDVTAQKFVRSWFTKDDTWANKSYGGPGTWKEVRDRLYRSGDLGRYMPDGNVECCGRADDQVKIRGFRIELGEIDTHLSRHPLVRENVTLLRRNKDEEPTLVSYFVPDQGPQLDSLLSINTNKNVKRLTVLISGSGSNLQALIDATKTGVLSGTAEITCVISNRKDAYGLKRAENAGIQTKVWSLAKSRKQHGDSREKYDAELARLILEDGSPDLVICAGFMHILSPDFLAPMTAANVGIINLHPALPGQFNGSRAIERAYEAGKEGKITKTGIMIHWVIAEVDMGEPILIREIPLSTTGSLEDLQAKIHEEEHRAIVIATNQVLSGKTSDALVERMQKYQPLVKDIRNYLKGKLASYAIPTVFVPMEKMPLNPNGKVDKPALPYPDTAQQAAISKVAQSVSGALDPTQQTMHDIWCATLPHAPSSIPIDENFFDLGGHSILATKLIFQIRRTFVIDNVPLGLIFKEPTIAGLSREIEKLRSGDTTTIREGEADQLSEPAYAQDARDLCDSDLPKSFATRAGITKDDKVRVFLTGATGFLGTFLIRDLLERPSITQVIAHVRAKDEATGRTRLITTLEGYGVWKSEWHSRIAVVCGDLGAPRLGLSEDKWAELSDSVDCIIHNGALVHWVFPYSQLRAPNVLGTVTALQLCATGKPKNFTFVSSTSVLDTEHFVRESDRLISLGEDGVSESDDLSGSSTGLGTGYGQTKWAAEFVTREAGRRGLAGCVVRPGYIVGDSITGVTNTDDFIIRLIKGCIQIGAYPNIHNPVNMVPVDHVARVVCATTMSPPRHPTDPGLVHVAHVTGHPRSRFIDFLGTLSTYGFKVEKVDYIPWKAALESYISSSSISVSSDVVSQGKQNEQENEQESEEEEEKEQKEQNALYPLLHFVTEDLPANTKAPDLSDTNTQAALRRDEAFTNVDVSGGRGVGVTEMGVMLAFLCAIGYIRRPAAPSTQRTESGDGGRNGGDGDNDADADGTKAVDGVQGVRDVLVLPDISVAPDVLEKFRGVGGRGSAANLYISIDHKGDEARTSKPQENKGVGHHGQQGSVHPTSRVLVPEER